MPGLVKDLIDSAYLQVEGTEYPTLDVTRKDKRSARDQCSGFEACRRHQADSP